MNNKIVVFDIETTGTNPFTDKIIEIGAVKVINDQIVDEWNYLINPNIDIPQIIQHITGISNDMVKDKPAIDFVLEDFVSFCIDCDIMGHNVIFDYSFIKANCMRLGLDFEKNAVDTLKISRLLLADIPSRKLSALCEYYNIDLKNAHRAKYDALGTYYVYKHMKEQFYQTNPDIFKAEKILWQPPELTMITPRQKSYLYGLVQKHNVKLDKPIEAYTKAEATKTINSILTKIRYKN